MIVNVHLHFAGRLYPNVTIASPGITPPRSCLHSFISNGPAASCTAYRTVPGKLGSLAEMTCTHTTELTTASISSLVMSPSHRDTFLLMAVLGRYSESPMSQRMLSFKGQPSALELNSAFSKLAVETDYDA